MSSLAHISLLDSYGDAICCGSNGNGFYNVKVDSVWLFGGGDFEGKRKTHIFDANFASVRRVLGDENHHEKDAVLKPSSGSLHLSGPPLQCPDPNTTMPAEWHTIISESFESPDFGLGQYDCSADHYKAGSTFFAQLDSDGHMGSTALTKNPYVHHVRLQHTNTLRLNDNQGSNSAVFTEPIDISCFKTVELSFEYMTDRLKKIGEKDRNGFVVEYRILRQHKNFYKIADTGRNISASSLQPLGSQQAPWEALDFFLLGVDFTQNGKKYSYQKEFEPCCGSWVQFRITSRTLHKNEYIFIDNFGVKGHPGKGD